MDITKYDMQILQGKTYEFVGNVVHKATGLPFDLSAYSARMQIRPTKDSGTVLADVTSMIVINNPTQGQLTLTIPAATTAGYTWRTGQYDLELYTSGDALVHGAFEGYVTVSLEVTR